MKKYIALLSFFILLSCGSDDDNNPVVPDPLDPVINFTVNVTAVGFSGAQIAWETPTGVPDTDWVYRVVLNNEVVADGLHTNNYAFSELEDETLYTGTVFATSSKGNQTFSEFSFTTTLDTIYYGDLTLRTQEEVDNFYYTKIEGSLIIRDSDITNLDGLQSLTYIKTSIGITSNNLLNNIDGLVNIISGGENPGSLVSLNPQLENVSGLNNYFKICQYVRFTDNEKISDLSYVRLRDDSQLVIDNLPLTKLPMLNSSFKGELYLYDLDVVNFSEFSNLTEIKILRFKNLNKLINFEGLNNLTKVETNIEIESVALLNNFQGLNNLQTIKNITIKDAYQLATFQGLENLQEAYEISVNNADRLQTLQGLNSLNDLTILSIIDSNEIINLGQMNNLTDIRTLRLYRLNSFNSFEGLNNVTSIYNIELTQLPQLNQFQGLNNLNNIAYFSMNYMDGLQNFQGLDNLVSVGEIDFYALDQIINFQPFSNLALISKIKMANMPQLTSLDGFNNLIGSSNPDNKAGIYINDCPNLTDYCALRTYLNNVDIRIVYVKPIGNVEEYFVYGNAYNPTLEQIRTEAGCSL